MRTETKENLANLAYPIAIAATFGALEYFGVSNFVREFELDKLSIKEVYYGSQNPRYWGEVLSTYIKPYGLEAIASLIVGGIVGAGIAEPIKKLINRTK